MEIIENKAVRFRTHYFQQPAPHRKPKRYAGLPDILRNTHANGDCMEWAGALSKDGYAACGRGGILQSAALHREVYRLATGATPPVVMHTCDNRCCINPAHLIGGTAQLNHEDKIHKGRQAKGVTNGRAIFTVGDVCTMRDMHRRGVDTRSIEVLFSVSHAHLWRILTNKNWSHCAHY